MSGHEGVLVSDLLAHPAATHIAALSRVRPDVLSEGEADDLEMDVMVLEGAAAGLPLPDAHGDLDRVRAIRAHLEDAEEEALALSSYLACRPVADGIARLRHRLELVERIAAAEANRNPKRRGPSRNEPAYLVAIVAVRIFERRTGVAAEARKLDDRTPANAFSGFVKDIFEAFRIPRTDRKPGIAGWYEPAREAVTAIRENK